MKAWACGLALWAGIVSAVADELRVAVDASTEMPWSLIHENHLISGLHFDLGQALARELGLEARFVLLPRKRLSEALTRGDADLACALLPSWLPGPFDWSTGFIGQTYVVLTVRSAPAPASLKDLAGQPIGTINGFTYPELDRALGAAFVRDDAPSAATNLAKLAIGRMRHSVVEERLFAYAHDETVDNRHGERQLDFERRALSHFGIDFDFAAQFLNVAFHHIHSHASTRNGRDFLRRGEAGQENQIEDFLA